MGSGDNFTIYISEQLHIAKVKEAYRSSTKVNHIGQMLKHNDRCTGPDYVEDTLSNLALHGWYDIYSVKVFNLLSATDKWRSTRKAQFPPQVTAATSLARNVCPHSVKKYQTNLT